MAYNILRTFQLVTDGAISADFTSPAMDIKQQDNVGVQLKWTGDLSGEFRVEVSIDHQEDSQKNVRVAGNWVALTLNPAITAAGAPDDAYIDLNQLSAPYMRVIFDRTSGTGVLNVNISLKGV
jgi:hypothetical protein